MAEIKFRPIYRGVGWDVPVDVRWISSRTKEFGFRYRRTDRGVLVVFGPLILAIGNPWLDTAAQVAEYEEHLGEIRLWRALIAISTGAMVLVVLFFRAIMP